MVSGIHSDYRSFFRGWKRLDLGSIRPLLHSKATAVFAIVFCHVPSREHVSSIATHGHMQTQDISFQLNLNLSGVMCATLTRRTRSGCRRPQPRKPQILRIDSAASIAPNHRLHSDEGTRQPPLPKSACDQPCSLA